MGPEPTRARAPTSDEAALPGTRAWKFLARGAIAPFSGHRWPVPAGASPGAWVRGAGLVYGCAWTDLPWWLDAELWELELEGPVRAGVTQLCAPAGRLVRRLAGWDADAVRAYGTACAHRARDVAVSRLRAEGRLDDARALAEADSLPELVRVAKERAGEARTRTGANLAAYVAESATRASQGAGAAAANIAANAVTIANADPAAFDAERAWQARWIAARAGIDTGAV